MAYRKPGWHPTADCEDSDALAARRLRKLKSDLFSISGTAPPPAQNEIMHRNASTSPLLRLPPEIRLRIYKFVLGGRQFWIGQTLSKYTRERTEFLGSIGPKHRSGELFHYDAWLGELDLRPLRICRQVFMESALLPYALNTFVFQNDEVRRAFEKAVRPGKKRVQKKAVGKYEVMEWEEFRAWLSEESGWEIRLVGRQPFSMRC